VDTSKGKSRPVRGAIYAALSVPCWWFAAAAMLMVLQGTLSFVSMFPIATYLATVGATLSWRAWCNFDGTWNGWSETLKGPMGKVLISSVLAAKALTELERVHFQFLDANPNVIRAGLIICALAPILLWLKSKAKAVTDALDAAAKDVSQ
jgi:hypothetical protein